MTAVALARLWAERDPTLLVDLAGEVELVLGSAPASAGVAQWLAAERPPPDALSRLERPAGPGLSLLPAGDRRLGATETPADDRRGNERRRLLAHLLAADDRTVVVDVGAAPNRWAALVDLAAPSLLVTRPCYLALSAATGHRRPDGIVVVRERGRALGDADIAAAIGAPVVATIPHDPAVARAVDAGLLGTRLPRPLRHLEPLVAVGCTP
ncbi:MAG: hypothetical protein ACFCVK_01205 [Acidimicrobiales bacterium]